VVERAQLDKLLGEQKLKQTGAIDPATAKEVGRIAGVDAIITGSVTDLQSMVGINARLIDTATGEIFAEAQVKITKDDDVKKIMTVVLKTGTATVRPASPKPDPTLLWSDGPLRFSIDGLHGNASTLTTTIVVENTGDQARDLNLGAFHLIDDNGDRWFGQASSGEGYLYLVIAPETCRRLVDIQAREDCNRHHLHANE
jgi:hypothetical protein